ncbi:MAG: hypothetical protein CYG61_02715 [Actinobacteria bacterium]|nr:MAG: hypothetical protein CYG61_02715 [Actinomycetota bacterium]
MTRPREDERLDSSPADDLLVLLVGDESAPLGGRIEALKRIGHDQLESRAPLVAPLLDHNDPLLRGTAAYVLVGLWRMVAYLDRVLDLLGDDDEGSAGALSPTTTSRTVARTTTSSPGPCRRWRPVPPRTCPSCPASTGSRCPPGWRRARLPEECLRRRG